MFYEGGLFPPAHEIERLSKYYRGRKIFDGKAYEVVERMSELLKDTPHAKQLEKLYMAVNIMDVLLVKPADMLVGEPPTYSVGGDPESPQQSSVEEIVEENDLNQLIHELTVGGGIRGDSVIKVYYDYRHDFSESPNGVPAGVTRESIIEAVNPMYFYPELSHNSAKRFKAVNIAIVEWSYSLKDGEVPYLNVERHVPGFIHYERYRLTALGVDNTFGAHIMTFMIGEQVPTGRAEGDDVVETGVPQILVHHIPYKSVDDNWAGISGIEKIESILAAINDTLVQLDYILHKHSDPTAYGPTLDSADVRIGGKYIPVEKNDVVPGYMTFVSSQQLDGIFKELDLLIGLVFQMSETPQWLFGTQISKSSDGGTGTSHTDGGAIKARFLPILTKVRRIRSHVDRALRDALYNAQQLENFANEGVAGFESYEPIYPKISWRDGVPKDDKSEAETMQIRTGGRATLDVKTAIKVLDGLNDNQAKTIEDAISADEKAAGFVTGSVFNGSGGGGGA